MTALASTERCLDCRHRVGPLSHGRELDGCLKPYTTDLTRTAPAIIMVLPVIVVVGPSATPLKGRPYLSKEKRLLKKLVPREKDSI